MENKEIRLSSGNTLTFQHATFKTKLDLLNAVLVSVKENNLLSNIDNFTEEELMPNILNSLLSATVNKDVDALFWECAKSCLWNGVRINPQMFETDEDSWQDFVEIKFHIVKENIAVFTKSLLSGSGKGLDQLKATITSIQK